MSEMHTDLRRDPAITELREMLIRMEAKMEHLSSLVSEGMPRCVAREQRLTFLERKFDLLSGRLWWFASAMGLSMLMLGIRAVWGLLTA